MDINRRGSRPTGLPEIYVQDSNFADRCRISSRSSLCSAGLSPTTSSIPMSIPNAREPVPPPLPPPRHLKDIANGGGNGGDIAWKWGNSHDNEHEWGTSSPSVAPGSSLYGDFESRKNSTDDRPEIPRRQSSNTTIKSFTVAGTETNDHAYPRSDEGYASLSSLGSHNSRYQDSPHSRSGFQSSVHDKFRSNAQAYDKSLLQKLDARRGSDNKTPPRSYATSPFSTSASDASPTSRIASEHRQPNQLKPLSLPILPSRSGLAESPLSRWVETPLSSGVSPGNSFARFGGHGQYDFRSPSDAADSDRFSLPCIGRSGSGSAMSTTDDASSVASRSRDSYDRRVSPDNDVDFQMEETGLRRLYIDDQSSHLDAYSPGATTGQKRRASSPPGEEGPSLHTVGSASDLFRRRESASRASPTPRLHSISGSISSVGSAPRNNSYTSTMSLSTSSITSAGSHGRLSPGGVSPGGTDMSDSPYVTSVSLNSSPRGSISRPNHQRNLSDSRPLMSSRKLSDGNGFPKQSHLPPGVQRVQGLFMCECCPKKPKKFDSQEELNLHEQEKQYECAYCRNRFKNKNEAERHQNSLHLRRHSWSCAALTGYAAAFHSSSNRPNEADTCGYCGEDFPRSGMSTPSRGPQTTAATEQDWDTRIVHLQEMHKFRECNHAKKFFRADHFRQHLKHSHAGTSGKWTNMLENACMKDEPLPEPIRGPERISPGGPRVGRINEEDEIL